MLFIDNKTTRANIFALLAKQAPLTAKQVFERINAQRNQKITVQGIHKLLKQMVQQKILCKNKDKRYFINKRWLKKIRRRIEQTEKLLQ